MATWNLEYCVEPSRFFRSLIKHAPDHLWNLRRRNESTEPFWCCVRVYVCLCVCFWRCIHSRLISLHCARMDSSLHLINCRLPNTKRFISFLFAAFKVNQWAYTIYLYYAYTLCIYSGHWPLATASNSNNFSLCSRHTSTMLLQSSATQHWHLSNLKGQNHNNRIIYYQKVNKHAASSRFWSEIQRILL